MQKYICKIPYQDSVGSVAPFVVKECTWETKEQNALSWYNCMLENGGSLPARRLPSGTKFIKFELYK